MEAVRAEHRPWQWLNRDENRQVFTGVTLQETLQIWRRLGHGHCYL